MKKILVLGSDKSVVEPEINILSHRDLHIKTSTSKEETLHILSGEKIDLVICKMQNPVGEYCDLCRTVRRDNRLRNVSIIFSSRPDNDETVEDCIRAGANDHIPVTAEPEEFIEKVSKFINIATRRNSRIPVELKVKGKVDEKIVVGLALNISISGFLLETQYEFYIGQIVDFSIIIPGNDKHLEVKGEIVRLGEGSSPNVFFHGIRFIDMGSSEHETLSNFVEDGNIGELR